MPAAGLSTLRLHRLPQVPREGNLGNGPRLTGYGSPAWLVGIISDPAHRRFYGSKNDRMPAYAAAADPAKNLLSDEELGILADWLRGQ